jgi:hypothetical protein
MKQIKIQLVPMLAVGLVAYAIDSSALFSSNLVGMAMQKPSNLAVGDFALRHRAAEFFQHLSSRWQAVSCATFYVSH